MNIDQTLEQLSHLQYPRQVDVTERVMAQVMQRPYLQPRYVSQRRRQIWQRVSAIVAAAMVTLVVFNVAMVYTRSYDDEGMGSMIAHANDYSSWNTVEEMAVNPYEYLYEE